MYKLKKHRIPYKNPVLFIEQNLLKACTEKAESYLTGLGFRDFRVRYLAGQAKLQLPAHQLPLLLERRQEVLAELSKHYSGVLLDLEVRGE